MNTDIRISTKLLHHHKFTKFKRKVGPMAAEHLLQLWCYVADNRPGGVLEGMDHEDIAIAGHYEGDADEFVDILLSVGWIDLNEDGIYCIHDWIDHNPWAANSDERGDQSRFNRMAKTHPELYQTLKAQGHTSITKEDFQRLTKKQGTVKDSLTNRKGPLTSRTSPKTNNQIPYPKTEEKILSASQPQADPDPEVSASGDAVSVEGYFPCEDETDEQQGESDPRQPERPITPEEVLVTKKKRKLKGQRLALFNRFWDAFDYKRGRAEAADAWIDIAGFTPDLAEVIIERAGIEARARPGIIQAGRTPKWAQGWLSGRRWEDELGHSGDVESKPSWLIELDEIERREATHGTA
jgi:hypothetical protein